LPSSLDLRDSGSDRANLVLLRVIAKFAGDGDEFRETGMDIIAMTALASAIHEAGRFQLRHKFSNFGGIRRGSLAADILATAQSIV
jgi:hypothetical protein